MIISPVRVFDGAAVAALGGVRVRGRRRRRRQRRRRAGVVVVQHRRRRRRLLRGRGRRRRLLPPCRHRHRLPNLPRFVLPRRRLPPLGRRVRLLRGRLGSVEFLTFISTVCFILQLQSTIRILVS